MSKRYMIAWAGVGGMFLLLALLWAASYGAGIATRAVFDKHENSVEYYGLSLSRVVPGDKHDSIQYVRDHTPGGTSLVKSRGPQRDGSGTRWYWKADRNGMSPGGGSRETGVNLLNHFTCQKRNGHTSCSDGSSHN